MINYTPARLLENKELNDFLDILNNKSIEELANEYCNGEFIVEMIVNQIEQYLRSISDLASLNYGGRGFNKNGSFGRYTVQSTCLNLLIQNLFDKPYSEENVKKANLYKKFWLEINKNTLDIMDKKISNFEKDFDNSVIVSNVMNEQSDFIDRNELSGMNVIDYFVLLEKEKQGATKEEIQELNKKQSWEEIPKDAEVFCNFCGLSCQLGDSDFHENHGLINQTVMGGYHSTPGNGEGTLDDMQVYRFSLCEFCLDHLFGKFKIPPRVTEYHGTESESWISAKDRVDRDEWRKMKKEFEENVKRHDEARNK